MRLLPQKSELLDLQQYLTPDELAEMDRLLRASDDEPITEASFVLIPPEKDKPLYEVIGGKIYCRFHDGQVDHWHDPTRFPWIIAGARSGKTSYLPIWALREAIRCGPVSGLAVGPDSQLMRMAFVPSFRALWEHALGLGKYVESLREFQVSAEGAKRLGMDRPFTVYFRHADSDSLESVTAGWAIADEAGQKEFKLATFEAAETRVSIGLGRIAGGTTPYNLGPLKQHVYDKYKSGNASYRVHNFASTANPNYPQEEADRLKAEMPPWKYGLRVLGIFSRPAGLIYDCCFDDEGVSLYTCKRFEIPANWPRWAWLDFGPVNTAVVFVAKEIVDDAWTGRAFAYRTYWPRATRSSSQHVTAIRQGEPELLRATGGARTTEQGWRDAFGLAGLKVDEPIIKDVEPGIDCVYGAFARRELIVFDDLEDLKNDVEGYTREVENDGEVSEKIAEKAKFHLCDCLRYGALKFWPPKRKRSVEIITA